MTEQLQFSSGSETPAAPDDAHAKRLDKLWASVASPAGYILAVSYPVLALSTGARALYQLAFRNDITNYLPVLMSGLAALCYLIAAIGFAYRRPTWWWVSVITLSFEMVMVLAVGTWSLLDPARVGGTVWRHYGEDYGFFPLIQPFVGLAWLFWPVTRRAYGIQFGRWARVA
jgi:hypothetical protein